MRSLHHTLMTLALLLGLCMGITANAHARLKVETTTQDLAAIANAIGGKHISARSLTPGSRDPHFAVAKPSMIRRVYHADLLLVIGAELEAGWLPALLQSARNSKIQAGQPGYLDLSTSVQLLGKQSKPVTRDMGDVHASGNPHYWLDPRNGVQIAKAISQRLIQLDPQHASDYQANFIRFKQMIEARYKHWRKAVGHLKGKAVIAYHTSFVYLANAFGFRIVDEVEPKPGITPSAASLARLKARIKREGIQQLIMEPYYERRSANYLKEETGIRVAIIPQSVGARDDIETYAELFDAIVAALNNTEAN